MRDGGQERSAGDAEREEADSAGADRLHDVGRVVALDQRQLEQASHSQRLAARLTSVYASVVFLVLEGVLVVAWIVVNSAPLGIRQIDRPPFPLLTLALTVEVLILSACVLIAQRGEGARAERRAQVMLHLDTVVEEKTSLLLRLLTELREAQGLAGVTPEVATLQATTDVTKVVEALDQANSDGAH